jgi:hypothetical protein
METNKRTRDRFKIGLKANGLHSLWRGIESYQQYKDSRDIWLLKEAVMFLHHGTELLMKEILVQSSEYLIFEDLGSNTVKKQKQAAEKNLGIFYLPKPPRTVTYLDAIDRVEAFINPPELDEPLLTRLRELNQYRNQLEHYAVDADAASVARLIANLHRPLVYLFEAQLGGIRQEEPATVSKTVDEAESLTSEYRLLERETSAVVKQFRGQRVPGRLFGIDEEDFILPNFEEGSVTLNHRPAELDGGEVDILGESGHAKWVVEVKANLSSRAFLWVLSQIAVNSELLGAKAWLIVFTDLPNQFKDIAREHQVLITDASEWRELKGIIEIGSDWAAG